MLLLLTKIDFIFASKEQYADELNYYLFLYYRFSLCFSFNSYKPINKIELLIS